MAEDPTPDDVQPDDVQPDDVQAADVQPAGARAAEPGTPPTPRRQGTAAASAASRARRIGGARPSASGRPAGAAGSTQSDADPAAADAPVSVEKAGRPARPRRAAVRGSTADAATTTSARDLAAGRSEIGGPVVITQVPAWLKWTPAVVLTFCALAMIVVVAVAAHGVWYAQPSSTAIRDKVLAAAKTCTATTNTYTYRSIAQDEAKGAACATGRFTQQYRKAMSTVVKPLATKLKASQSIQINNAGIEDVVSARQWNVVVYGQTKITETGQKDQNGPFAAQVTMQKAHGRWLIARIRTIAKTGS